MKTKRQIALIVSLVMILSSLSLITVSTVGVSEKPSNYYVKSGEIWDGRTEDKPAPTVYDVINSINADGLVAGDTANIYIMQNSNWNDAVGSLVGVGSVPAHKITAWAENGGAVPEHTAKIVVQSYGTATNNYLAFTGYLGKNAPLVISGPTEFKNIRLVSTREFRAGINFNGHDLILGEGTTYGYINNSEYANTPVAWNGKVNIDSGAFIETTISTKNGGTYDSPMNVMIESPYCQYGYSDGKILHIGAINNAKTTFNEDVNLTYNHSNTKAIFEWGSSSGNDYATTVFNKNINIKIDNAKTYDNTKTNSPVTINGGYQVIKKSTLAVNHSIESLSNVTIEGGYWLINNDFASDVINFTATKGVFNVKSGYTVTVTDDKDNIKIQSVNGLLTLPEGSYTIKSVKYSKNDYYVISGGSGAGRTEDKPASTVYDVINTINADGLSAEDTANIFIMQKSDWNSEKGSMVGKNSGTPAHKMTAWAENGGAVPEHTAKIVIQSYGTATNNYLAITGYLGKSGSLQFNGPTEFKNVKIVSTRQLDVGIRFAGCNVTLGEGTTFGYVDNSQYRTDSKWDGTIKACEGYEETVITGYSGGNYSKPMTVNIETKHTKRIRLGCMNRGSVTFDNDVNLIFNHENSVANLTWGSNGASYPTVFKKNLNINLKKTKNYSNLSGPYGTTVGPVIVNGGVQIICKASIPISGNLSTMSNIKLDGGYWLIKDSTDIEDLISFTNQKGKFAIKSGCSVIATNNVNGQQFSSTGEIIELPEGTYTISTSQSVIIKDGIATADGVEVTKADEGTLVTITENASSMSKTFEKWNVSTNNVNLSNATSPTATFIMPKGNVEISAVYKVEQLTENNMLYFKANNQGPLMQRVRGIIVGKTYHLSFKLSNNIKKFNVIALKDGDRPSVYIEPVRTLKDVKDGYTDYNYSFVIPEETNLGTSNLAFIGLEFSAGVEGYISDILLTEDGDSNSLFTNSTFTDGLDYWAWGWSAWFGYTRDKGYSEWSNNEVQLNVLSYNLSRFSTLKVEHKMLNFVNGANYTNFASRFKLKTSKSYILTFSAFSTNNAFDVVVLTDGDRNKIKANGKLISEEKSKNYTKYKYKFTVPQDYPNNTVGFVGIGIPAYAEGFIFDISCIIENDPNETECFSNTDFTSGLTQWIWGWKAWFGVLGTNTGSLTEWSYEENELKIENYDNDRINQFIALLNVDDGEWWGKKDIIEETEGRISVLGEVLTQNKNPATGIEFILCSPENEYSSVTNKSGIFSFNNFAPGYYELYYINGDGKRIFTEFFSNFSTGETIKLYFTEKADESTNYEIELESDYSLKKAPTGMLSGTVYTPQLKTVGDIEILLDDILKIKTDNKGNFKFEDVPVGKHSIYVVSSNGKKQLLKTIDIKENVEFTTKLKYEINSGKTDNKNTSNGNIKPAVIIIVTCCLAAILLVAVVILFIKQKGVRNIKK